MDRCAVSAIRDGRVLDETKPPAKVQRQQLLRIAIAVEVQRVLRDRADEAAVNRGRT